MKVSDEYLQAIIDSSELSSKDDFIISMAKEVLGWRRYYNAVMGDEEAAELFKKLQNGEF